jgi:pimeloyl-ACP methyl ester carboxylesterase
VVDFFTRGGLKFEVSDRGPGNAETVVLLHGFPQNREMWEPVAAKLGAAGYRTLAPDQRGYSRGARPSGRRSYRQSQLVADVLALIDQSGSSKVHLVGHDWGAFVGWAFASRHPERLLTLTAISVPHPRAFAWALPRGQARQSWYMAAFQLPLMPERLLRTRRGLELVGGENGLSAAQVASYLDALGSKGLSAALNWYRALPFSQCEVGYAGATRVPTTYVWSDDDAAIHRRAAEATGRFVDAPYRFEVLAGVSHWIPEQAPELLSEIIIDRLRSP